MNVNGLTGNSESELPDYEILKYEIVLNNTCDPDLNFLIKKLKTSTPPIYYQKSLKYFTTHLVMIRFQYYI